MSAKSIYVTAFDKGEAVDITVTGYEHTDTAHGTVEFYLCGGPFVGRFKMRPCDARALANALNAAVDHAIPELKSAGVEP